MYLQVSIFFYSMYIPTSFSEGRHNVPILNGERMLVGLKSKVRSLENEQTKAFMSMGTFDT